MATEEGPNRKLIITFVVLLVIAVLVWVFLY